MLKPIQTRTTHLLALVRGIAAVVLSVAEPLFVDALVHGARKLVP